MKEQNSLDETNYVYLGKTFLGNLVGETREMGSLETTRDLGTVTSQKIQLGKLLQCAPYWNINMVFPNFTI